MALSTSTVKFESLIPNLMVENVDETIKYYESVLGFRKLMSVQGKENLDWAMIARDGVNLMLQKRKSMVDEYQKFIGHQIGGTLTLYIPVKNIEELYKELEQKGNIYIRLHNTFYGRKEFTIEDCNGYTITFAEDVP